MDQAIVQSEAEPADVSICTWLGDACALPSPDHASEARGRQASLTKPAGSLGLLEQLAVDLAALQRTDRPTVDPAAIVVFAGDHGIAAQGVSAYPSSVTVEMLRNFGRGGAAINVLARELGAQLRVIDVGTLAETTIAGVHADKPRCGTRDFSTESAMTPAELQHCFDAGRRAIANAGKDGIRFVLLGEMGIGNTTSAAAIAASLLGYPSNDIVGAGTGLNSHGITHKSRVVARALQFHAVRDAGPVNVLCRVGGLEIAALTGAIVAAAQAQIPILIDGFIVSTAALVAVRLNPTCRPWMFFSHRSVERGHQFVLRALNAMPLLDLKLRLGEGSGAAVALPIVRLACKLHAEMATFEDAKVSRGLDLDRG